VILPFGIKLNQEGPKTILFYGPKGNGKTLMADTIINETHSVLLDISPFNIANLFQDKQSVT
jgi:AAA+ superfamily predicted ATPase